MKGSDTYLTRLQRKFVQNHGRKRYLELVSVLTSHQNTDTIQKEYELTLHDIAVWRQVIGLQQAYDECR